MDAAASADGTSPIDVSGDHVTPDQKLACLGSWLERTTLKETEAVHAYSVLPAAVLVIGTVSAAMFVGIGQRWFAIVTFVVFAGAALSLFLYHHRRWAIWHAAAVRLQNEQKLLADRSQMTAWAKAGQHPPEQLAQWYGRKEPLRPFAGPALALYLATIAFGIMLSVFATAKDLDRHGAPSAGSFEAPFGGPPTTNSWRPVL